MNRAKYKKGVTLLELSTVLILIGLIITGVLISQNVMEASKIHNIIAEVQAHQRNFNLFRERYRGKPGDFIRAREIFGTGTYSGNGDGVLCTDEAGQFWQHMYMAGYIEEAMTGISTAVDCATPNWALSNGVRTYPSKAMKGNFNSTTGIAYFGNTQDPYYYNNTTFGRTKINLSLARFRASLYSTNVGDTIFTPKFMSKIDAKADDSYPHTGNIRGARGNNNSATSCATNESWTGTFPVGDVLYQISDLDAECLAVFTIED
ncbi:MAG: hypothetical protein COV36_05885 [Alphaproteobacteria bacterium CG11_big_fil_rev_8_21_14_0_20_44_7]|nr:MAG: hypothetical protein COV36_05885 [Alphaproteobacteria bacterium CG11_big_fil_rev_8_21_14_0_20_44_7]